MSDLISRQAAIDALKEHEDDKGYLRGDFEEILEALPSAEPVRKGKWTWVPDREDEHITRLQCSVCHMGAFDETEFCPNCGASMSEGEEDE